MDWFKAKRDRRLMKSSTGSTAEEFGSLLPTFEAALMASRRRKKRSRGMGGGRKGVFGGAAKRSCFSSCFIRGLYPVFELAVFELAVFDPAGFLFGGVDRFRPCRWVRELLPVPEMALGRRCVLPKRRIKSIDEEKGQNRTISGIRMVDEHAMAGIERLCSTWHVYRNRKGRDDAFMLPASALRNFHLEYI